MIGRPRQFKETQALDAAMKVFWANGFQGTSYADLSKAMGLNRPSIYAAFGDKEELFLRAVDRCIECYLMPASNLLNSGKDCRTSFKEFFVAMIKNAFYKNHPGCLITTVLGEASSSSPVFRAKLKSLVEAGDMIVTNRLERAVKERELSEQANIQAMGILISNFVVGFAVRARAGESERSLGLVAEEAAKILFPS